VSLYVPLSERTHYMHTLEAPGYALIGVQAGMKLPQGVSVYLDARNLANVHYVSDITTIIDARGQIPQNIADGRMRGRLFPIDFEGLV